jgi:hypothetical protein
MRPPVKVRVRSFRLALLLAAITGLYMFLSLPLLQPTEMSSTEWASAISLGTQSGVAFFSIFVMRRFPQPVVVTLAIAALYSAFVLAKLLVLFISSTQFSGPTSALGPLLAGSMCVAVIRSAVLAWPLRFGAGS